MSHGPRILLLSCLGLLSVGWAALPLLTSGQRGEAGDWAMTMAVATLVLSVPMLAAGLKWSDARRDAAEAEAQRGEGAAGERPATTDRIWEP